MASVQRTSASPATVFIGRESEAARLAALLEKSSLVTLWGGPGLGKTRLAQRLADSAGPAVFVDLTEATDASGLCERVARALGLQLLGRTADDIATELGRALAGRGTLLVVLDNFEQLVDAAAATVTRWRAQAPLARFLVTSRVLLAVPGEVPFGLEPLSLPQAGKPAADSDALQLFVARAAAARGEYQLTAADLPAVTDVVAALEGIPLAIELAASRMGVLSATALRDRLHDRFALLRSQDKYPTERQATLRGAIDWSWHLLDAHEQSALAQLSVFRGAFPLQAAEAVVQLGKGAPSVLDVVTSLHRRSLLRHKATPELPNEVRLAMYLSVREYARERLDQSKQTRAAMARHATWALQFAEPLAAQLERTGTAAVMQQLTAVHENLVAVHQRALARQLVPASLALDAALALDLLLVTRGPFDLHLSLLEGALKVSKKAKPALLARAHLALGRAHTVRGQLELARGDFSAALKLAKTARNSRLQGVAMGALGNIEQERGQFEAALGWYRKALPKVEAAGDLRHQGIFLVNVATVHFLRGDFDGARPDYQRALELFQALGNQQLVARVQGALGNVHFQQRRHSEARVAYEQALAGFRALHDTRYEGIYLGNLGQLHQEERRFDEARRCLVDQVDILRRVGDLRFLAVALESLGSLELERTRAAEAARAFDEALTLRGELGETTARALALAGLVAAHSQGGRLDRAVVALGQLQALGPLDEVASLYAAQYDVARAAKARNAAERAALRAKVDPLLERSASSTLQEIRVARRQLAEAVARLDPGATTSQAVLEVGPECRWFRPPGGERYDFKRGTALRLMLEALVQQKLSAPGTVLTVDRLFELGWPGERALADAAANRVYVNLSRLKDMGLRQALLRRDEGYLLDPALDVVRAP